MYKLICFDMEGVIFKSENFWMKLHDKFGTMQEGKVLTAKYLHTDYDRLVQEVVVRLWKGKDAAPYYELVNSFEYLPGVAKVFEYIKSKDFITAIISGSSIDVARRVQHDYGIDHLYANELVIRNGKVAGEFVWPVGAGKEKKAEIVSHLCSDLSIPAKEVIFIGDSSVDLEAFKEVGLSIAFNCQSKELKEAASHIVDSSSLSDIIPYLPP